MVDHAGYEVRWAMGLGGVRDRAGHAEKEEWVSRFRVLSTCLARCMGHAGLFSIGKQ